MNRTDVMLRLQQIFDDLFIEEVKLTEELTANDVDEWDSLIHITLVVAVEKAFDVRFRIGEVESTANVGQFVDLICKRQNQA